MDLSTKPFREVIACGEIIRIYTPKENSNYTALYVSPHTRQLDSFFGLNGEDSHTLQDITSVLSFNEKGFLFCSPYTKKSQQVGRVVSSNILIAKKLGNFFGYNEEDYRRNFLNNAAEFFSENDLETTLNFKDPRNNGGSYLKRIEVEGRQVIFPNNLNIFEPETASFLTIFSRLAIQRKKELANA